MKYWTSTVVVDWTSNIKKNKKIEAEIPECHEFQVPQLRQPQDENPSLKNYGTISSVTFKRNDLAKQNLKQIWQEKCIKHQNSEQLSRLNCS